MTTSIRVEFVKLGRGGFAQNVISQAVALDNTGHADAPSTIALTTSGLATTALVAAPVTGRDGELYARLTAIGGPAHVLITKAGTVATLTNGIRLPAEIPTLFALRNSDFISAVAES